MQEMRFLTRNQIKSEYRVVELLVKVFEQFLLLLTYYFQLCRNIIQRDEVVFIIWTIVKQKFLGEIVYEKKFYYYSMCKVSIKIKIFRLGEFLCKNLLMLS